MCIYIYDMLFICVFVYICICTCVFRYIYMDIHVYIHMYNIYICIYHHPGKLIEYYLYYFNFLAQESIPYSIDTSELSYISCPIHGAFAHN